MADQTTTKRARWTQEDLTRALDAVKNNQMSTYKAADTFGVPRRTIRRHIKENKNVKSVLGGKPTLSKEEEADLCRRIMRLADVGFPLTSKILRLCVYKYCLKNEIRNKFSAAKKIAGRKWLAKFLARHPEISQRKAQNLNPARAQKVNRFIVSEYFQKLKSVMMRMGIMGKPEKIYNLDEKGCRLNLHKAPRVLAKKGSRRVHIVGKEHGESVTIVACVSAIGTAVPPMILFKGVRMKPECVDNLPHGSICQMTPKGCMTTQSFIHWIHHFGRYKVPGPVLLIFDGAKCHLDYEIVTAADQYEITLFCLPANTTHELQPLDKSVFRPFESYWDEEVMLYFDNTEDRNITKQRFGRIFTPVWDKATTPKNIKSGFSATGIFPYNPGAIPDEAYAPSVVTEKPLPEPGENQLSTSVESSSVNQPSTSDDSGPSTSTGIKRSTTLKSSSPRTTILPCHQEDQLVQSIINSNSSDDDEDSDRDRENVEVSDNSANDDNKINNSFSSLLPTPNKSCAPKRKYQPSINSRAVEVTRNLFSPKSVSSPKQIIKKVSTSTKNKLLQKSTPDLTAKGKSVTKKKLGSETWWCHICGEEKVLDMRICIVCLRYVHEECVGLTKKDKLSFVCPNCEN